MNALNVGLIVNSALYLTGVFIAGLLFDNPLAWVPALMSAGLAVLCYQFQIFYFADEALWARKFALTLFGLSLAAGVIGGISLLV